MTPKRVNYRSVLSQLLKKRNEKQEINIQSQESQIDSTLLDYYTSLVQNHPDIILVFSLDGKVISQNREVFIQYLGYHPEKDIEFKELVSEETYALLHTSFNKATNGETGRQRVEICNR